MRFVEFRLCKACRGVARQVRKEIIMVYSWKTYNYAVSADVVGKEFEKIEKQYGKLTNDLVLQNAEDEDSPIHELFEWDDAVAGHKYRLTQATQLIINLAYEPEEQTKPKPVRAYYNVAETEKKGSFVNMKSAFSNPDSRDIILKRALRELESFKEKYQNLSELAGVFSKIDELLVTENAETEE